MSQPYHYNEMISQRTVTISSIAMCNSSLC